ncbi:MAG: hypothetical protein QM500_19810 [Methylococcales bacterium]
MNIKHQNKTQIKTVFIIIGIVLVGNIIINQENEYNITNKSPLLAVEHEPFKNKTTNNNAVIKKKKLAVANKDINSFPDEGMIKQSGDINLHDGYREIANDNEFKEFVDINSNSEYLPDISMTHMCWDNKNSFYTEGAVISFKNQNYKCRMIGVDSNNNPMYYWEYY